MKTDFPHVVLEGTPCVVGHQQAEILKNKNPQAAKWFTSAATAPKKDEVRQF
jgi:hypothetical protein